MLYRVHLDMNGLQKFKNEYTCTTLTKQFQIHLIVSLYLYCHLRSNYQEREGLVTHETQTTIVSGHFDKKVRFWDSRQDSSSTEIQLQGRLTSLDLTQGMILTPAI
jgi:hypothetical protein